MIDRPNYTQTPNIFFDKIMKTLNESETKVLLAIIRKTFGWQKIRDKISLTQLQELTGFSRQGVLNGLYGNIKSPGSGLINKGIVKVELSASGNIYELIVNEVDQETAEGSQRSRPEVVNEVDQLGLEGSQPSRHTKKRVYINKKKESLPFYQPIHTEIIKYLNEATGYKYQTGENGTISKAYVTVINARIKEKRTFEEFKDIIDYKTWQWLNDSKMKKYLNPETLFRSGNFDKYLEQMKNDAEYETPEQKRARLKKIMGGSNGF